MSKILTESKCKSDAIATPLILSKFKVSFMFLKEPAPPENIVGTLIILSIFSKSFKSKPFLVPS